MDSDGQGVLFDDRFLDRYAGSIISDPAVAIVELVANAWDAYATRVDIVWPERTKGIPFSISDNGKGMTPEQFQRRWKTLDYNRLADEGSRSTPPADLEGATARMLGLRDKLKDVPFLKERGLDSEAFLRVPEADTADLLSPAQ